MTLNALRNQMPVFEDAPEDGGLSYIMMQVGEGGGGARPTEGKHTVAYSVVLALQHARFHFPYLAFSQTLPLQAHDPNPAMQAHDPNLPCRPMIQTLPCRPMIQDP